VLLLITNAIRVSLKKAFEMKDFVFPFILIDTYQLPSITTQFVQVIKTLRVLHFGKDFLFIGYDLRSLVCAII
jgi:hypothetical protein